MCIGLVVTPEGPPLCYEVFAGNRADVTTVKEIIEAMEAKYGVAERIWAMDRGMVSEKTSSFFASAVPRFPAAAGSARPKAGCVDFNPDA